MAGADLGGRGGGGGGGGVGAWGGGSVGPGFRIPRPLFFSILKQQTRFASQRVVAVPLCVTMWVCVCVCVSVCVSARARHCVCVCDLNSGSDTGIAVD